MSIHGDWQTTKVSEPKYAVQSACHSKSCIHCLDIHHQHLTQTCALYAYLLAHAFILPTTLLLTVWRERIPCGYMGHAIPMSKSMK
jgi:hypothetical protein